MILTQNVNSVYILKNEFDRKYKNPIKILEIDST